MQTDPQSEEEELQRLRSEIEILRQECDTLKRNDFYLVVESMPHIVWMTLPEGEAVYANHQWFDYTGTTAKQSTEDKWLPFIHPDDQEKAVVLWHTSLDEGIPYEVEARICNIKTGEYRWFLVRAIPLLDVWNKVTKWVGTATDIDKRKRAEEALHRSQREKETRIRQMSDKLQMSLRMLKLTAHHLTEKQSEQNVQEMKDPLMQMNIQIDTLATLIDDLYKINNRSFISG
jgi:PAS domain S-box-containing protein